MNAEEYLQRVEKIDAMIRNKKIEAEQWRYIAQGSSGAIEGDRVQSSGNQQKMEAAVAKYVDTEEEIKQLVMQKDDIIHTIEQLGVNEYDVLHKLYIQFMDMNEVAEQKGKSYEWVKAKRKKGLRLLQGILSKKYPNVPNCTEVYLKIPECTQ